MTWFNFPGWGDYNLNGAAEKELVATGAHGYATQAQADAKPNASPSPAQQLLLQGFNLSSLSPVGAAGAGGVLQTPHSTGGISGAASNILGSTGNIIGDATKFIGQGSIWMRATEIIAGLMLLYAGVKALTAPPGTSNIARISAKQAYQHSRAPMVKTARAIGAIK